MAILVGTNGNDFLQGTEGDDTLIGADGDDTIFAGSGNDSVEGGDGNDFAFDGEGNDYLSGGDGDDRLIATEGDDTLIGGDGNDRLEVDAGFSPAGNDVVVGGDGRDALHFYGRQVVIDLESGTLVGTPGFGTGTVTATLEGIEDVFVQQGSAYIIGNSEDNVLASFTFEDDTIVGAGGNDTLNAAGGNDRYVFNVEPGEENADIIQYFTRHEIEGIDKIVLDSSVMTELGAAGNFSEEDERFYSAAGATGGAEDDDRVIYDTDAGRLYYDPDGSGDATAQLIATVFVAMDANMQPDVLRAGDIVVI